MRALSLSLTHMSKYPLNVSPTRQDVLRVVSLVSLLFGRCHPYARTRSLAIKDFKENSCKLEIRCHSLRLSAIVTDEEKSGRITGDSVG